MTTYLPIQLGAPVKLTATTDNVSSAPVNLTRTLKISLSSSISGLQNLSSSVTIQKNRVIASYIKQVFSQSGAITGAVYDSFADAYWEDVADISVVGDSMLANTADAYFRIIVKEDDYDDSDGIITCLINETADAYTDQLLSSVNTLIEASNKDHLVDKGSYNAATGNAYNLSGGFVGPLHDNTGISGEVYKVIVSGSQNFGSGVITLVADDLISHNGTKWDKFVDVASESGGFIQSIIPGSARITVDNTDPANPVIDVAVTGAGFRGNYDASSGDFPSEDGSGPDGDIQAGDYWLIDVGGEFPGGDIVEPGDLTYSLVNEPGQTPSNWQTVNKNIGYTPEDIANKEDTTLDTSSIKYPTNRLVKQHLDTKVDANEEISSGTYTKISFDSKGLVTGGEEATTDDIPETEGHLYFTEDRARMASVENALNQGETTKAPSQDAVVNALTTVTDAVDTIGDSLTATQDDLGDLESAFSNHANDTNNPHSVTKSQVGLGNVQNVDTTDATNITSGALANARLADAPNANAINFYIDKYEGLASNSGKLLYKFKGSPREAMQSGKLGSSFIINPYQYNEDWFWFDNTTYTADTSNGSNVLNNVNSLYLGVGFTVSGTGIPGGTTITAINSSTSVTLSNNATATNTGVTLTFTIPTSTLRDNYYVEGKGSTGSYPTVINGDLTIKGVVTRFRLRDIQIGSDAGKGKLTLNGTEGRGYFDNVYFGNGITALNTFKRWHDFNGCSAKGVISLGETGTPAAGTEFLFNGGDYNDITDLRIGHANVTVKFLNCRRLPQKITWLAGKLSFEGINILEAGSNTTFIDGTCNSSSGSLYLGGGFNFKRKSGVNGAIKSNGTAPITLGLGVRDLQNDVFSGSVTYLQTSTDIDVSNLLVDAGNF